MQQREKSLLPLYWSKGIKPKDYEFVFYTNFAGTIATDSALQPTFYFPWPIGLAILPIELEESLADYDSYDACGLRPPPSRPGLRSRAL